MTAPLVSAIVPTYDNARYIAECLDSAIAQTYANLEVVVVDDCSTDQTPEIVEAYEASFPGRVRFFRAAHREGPCRRRNDAIQRARGSVLAWLDADDVWLPTKIERQVERLADDRIGFVYTDWAEIDADGRPLPQLWPHFLRDGELLADLFVHGCFICSSSSAFRRSALDLLGGTLRDADFSFGDDYDLWLRLSLRWKAACVPETLTLYRRHGRNESGRRHNVNFHVRRVELLREFLVEHPEAFALLGRARRAAFARHHLRAARFEQVRRRRRRAASHALRGVAIDPVTAARAVVSWARARTRLARSSG